MPELILKDVTKIFPIPPQKRHVFRKKEESVGTGANITPEGVVAVRKLNLEIEKGELIVLLGASGSGKSTVLRLIAGLEQPDDGEIIMDGEPVNDVIPEDREVAMVFQNYSLYPHLTVFDNIAFSLHAAHMPRKAVAEKVRPVAELLELTDVLERYPQNLSGGQQQRVALGRALVRNPRFLLLDEPFANLDAHLRAKLRTEVKRIHSQLGLTMVYVTHDQVEALLLGTRIVVLRDGIVQQIGTPQQIYNAPCNPYVASLVGDPQMNLHPNARLRKNRGQWQVSVDGYTIGLPMETYGQLPETFHDRDVILGVRPVHVTPSDTGLPVHVKYTEHIHGEVYVHLETRKKPITMALSEMEALGCSLHGGSALKVTFDPGKVHLFDARTQRRIG